ncbi:rho GTPase-activating protein 21-like isoform X2 [Physella acuta]|uniref:rho GTPase-activating protein 21-like isoform X2 n=1 Tax=Physella acuta TaxID=109671 RepID=UPI0027DDFD05|nr:rho GTPase-activating protein 21-like isoform X2 [Physella acuta]
MESKEPRLSSSSVLDWSGPHAVVIHRAEGGFGFTLRHFVVYPPQSVYPRDDEECNKSNDSCPRLCRELSLEPQDTIFVKSVKEGSPAEYAGLNTGDRIIAVNGESIAGKSYKNVIAAIHQSSQTLKLLVVPKDEDILQMAYQSQTGDSMYSSSSSLSDNSRLSAVTHQHSHSSSDITHGFLDPSSRFSSNETLSYGRHDVRHSFPSSQWPSESTDFSGSSLNDLNYSSMSQPADQAPGRGYIYHQPRTQTMLVQESGSSVSSTAPGKSKYSFGLYFPPKSTSATTGSSGSSRTISAESLSRGYEDSSEPQTFELRQPVYSYRKTSFDESSALSSSAKSRDFFIKYSSDKAASDHRNRYSPRHSVYERYSNESRPTYIISRSQTLSAISPTQPRSAGPADEAKKTEDRSRHYIPVFSTTSDKRGVSVYTGNTGNYPATQIDSRSQTLVVRIPYEPKKAEAGQRFGTTFALTHSPTATHIEIQKSIGKPIVSQRKFQFESGKHENTPPPSNGGYNRYKTEIEKIRTQPKFSSIAMRKASFEQSPERDPPGFNDPVDVLSPADYSGTDASQPTIKVRKISSERYTSQLQPGDVTESSQYQDSLPIKIVMSPCSTKSSSPLDEVLFLEEKQGRDCVQEVKPSDQSMSSHAMLKSVGCDQSMTSHTSESTLADSGVSLKSYHGSSDMLDGAIEGNAGASSVYSVETSSDVDLPSVRLSKPARKSSYLSAVNAPQQRSTTDSPVGTSLVQVQQQLPAQSLPYPSNQSSTSLHPASLQTRPFSIGSSHSLSSVGISNLPIASVAPTVMSSSDSCVMLGQPSPAYSNGSISVTMRKKFPDTTEDQANKLHRRTSYLMATARDRTNAVPIEKAFSSQPQLVTDHRPQVSGESIKHQNSVKLNKFFGETIPTIAEGIEQKIPEHEEVPEVIRKGPLSCKVSVIEGKKCSDRSWKSVYAVLKQTELSLTRESSSSSNYYEEQHIPMKSCIVEFARDYAKKKKNVFRVTTHHECEYLFQTEDRGTMLCWIQAIKSINEPDKAEKMEEMIASEREKHVPIEILPSSKMSPQLGHKGKKLSALSFKAKLSSSPSMRRKKSNASEKDKEESLKKGWIGRIPMMKSLKKHNEESSLSSLSEQDIDKMQFGVHLEDCFPSPHNEYVPLIVELCTRIVEARGLEVVGVYRVPGNSAAVNALTEEFNRGIDSVNIDNEKLLDINVISSLLKSFFRKLPEPLIPPDMYDAFIEANRHPDEDKRKLKIKRLLHLLPPHNNETLKHMAEHLNKVASYGNINKMDAKNLAIMFGPTLVRKKGDDTVSLVTDMSDQCRIVESIILHHEWFFSTWDQDNYIPMETTVETVNVEDGQTLSRDDDEEADSAISAKQIISSIVGAASKKLRSQQGKSNDSLDTTDSCSITSSATYNIDDSSYLAFTKSLSSIASSRSASEEFLERKSAVPGYLELHSTAPIANSEPDLMELEYADAGSPSFPRHFSHDSLVDKNDELEISHGLPTSLSRDAIHNTLKRIGNDVSALLHTFEQKQLKERERRRRDQELIEREHLRTQLELELEDSHSVDDWLAWKGGASRMPDLVSSSYLGQTYPYEEGRSGERKDGSKATSAGQVSPVVVTINDKTVQQMPRVGSHEDVLSTSKTARSEALRSVVLRPLNQRTLNESQQRSLHLAVSGDRPSTRPPSLRYSRRHGSLDSLIDMIDKQDKRASWASSDSEDGSDLLTSITTTFDQKLQILLNPKYKLTGASRKVARASEEVARAEQLRAKSSLPPPAYTVAALLDGDRSFRDPSLHRSAKSDPKIGIASRFERNDSGTRGQDSSIQQRPSQLPDFRSFLSKSHSAYVRPIVLTAPKKLDTSAAKSSRTEHRAAGKSGKGGESFYLGDTAESRQSNKENRKVTSRRRRHTVGGTEDLDHLFALSKACAADTAGRQRLSAWDQLQPVVAPGNRNLQAWINNERLRGSTPDLSKQ